MITITRRPGCITVFGHARYAPFGRDIVCAAVSALFQNFLFSMHKLTTDEIKTDIRAGNSVIEYGNLSDSGKLLVDSFFVGAKMIADEYPDYVRVTEP